MAALTKPAIIKLVELLIVCILIGLHCYSYSGTIGHVIVASGTIIGYFIILFGLFIAIVMGTPVNRRVDLFWSIVGIILFIVVGALAIEHFESAQGTEFGDTGLAKGAIAIIEAIVFLIDAIITFRGDS